ncbi:hypothetical protein [Kitasatospora kifunensis]|uniref:Secreted protein n=1 Tax=Kitasatospora kifunensis TaxID=58351 RepID=A0A7W7R5G2_KITKI|nr:hypothetical protein [Kitasatospora kifunensis]
MDKRNAMRAGAVSAAATLMMLLSSPAFAATGNSTEEQASGLSVAQSLGLFVATPIVLFAIIAGLVMLGTSSGNKAKAKKK